MFIIECEIYVCVKFVDNGEIVLWLGFEVVVSKYFYDEKEFKNDVVVIGLVKGGLWVVIGLVGKCNYDVVNFDMFMVIIGICGIYFGVLYCQDDCVGVLILSGQLLVNGLYVDVVIGVIQVINLSGL